MNMLVSTAAASAGALRTSTPANASARTTIQAQRSRGDEELWSLYEKFELAYDRMISLQTPEADAGSASNPTREHKTAHVKWLRAANSALRACRRVMTQPALTGEGLLMKIHVAGFDLDAARGTFLMPYRGLDTPAWEPSRFSDAGSEFVAIIAEDLRRAKMALS